MTDKQFDWIVALLFIIAAHTGTPAQHLYYALFAAVFLILSAFASDELPPQTIVISLVYAEPEKQPSPFGIHTSEGQK